MKFNIKFEIPEKYVDTYCAELGMDLRDPVSLEEATPKAKKEFLQSKLNSIFVRQMTSLALSMSKDTTEQEMANRIQLKKENMFNIINSLTKVT